MTKINELNLPSGWSLFGNKGACWSNQIHIAKNDLSGRTICGVPMLSSNHYRLGETTTEGNVPDGVCTNCSIIYKNMTK